MKVVQIPCWLIKVILQTITEIREHEYSQLQH